MRQSNARGWGGVWGCILIFVSNPTLDRFLSRLLKSAMSLVVDKLKRVSILFGSYDTVSATSSTRHLMHAIFRFYLRSDRASDSPLE